MNLVVHVLSWLFLAALCLWLLWPLVHSLWTVMLLGAAYLGVCRLATAINGGC